MIQITLIVSAGTLAKIAAILNDADDSSAIELNAMPATKPAPKAKAEKPATTAKPEVTATDVTGETAEAYPDVTEVTEALKGLAKANGRDAVVELLQRYGATNASGVPEDKRAEVIAACE